MIKKLFLLALTALLLNQSLAQVTTVSFEELNWISLNPTSGQHEDFILLKSGEKIFGKVNRSYNYADYGEIEFSSASGIGKYNPIDLLGFGLANGQLFQSKPLPGESEPVFLQVLVSGPMVLGSYRGKFYLDNGQDNVVLEAYYRKADGSDQNLRKYFKPYIYNVKKMLTGECGVLLYSAIERMSFNEPSFIRMVSRYFDCQNAQYQVHVAKVPFVEISPTLGGGIANFSISPTQRTDTRRDRLVSKNGFQGFVGVRFHEFRKLPRFSTDIRLGFSSYETEVLSSYEGGQFVWTGSENLKETAIFVPLSFNYSLFKRQNSEIYLGLILGYFVENITQSDGFIDFRLLTSGDVTLSESPILNQSVRRVNSIGNNFLPGVKVGSNFQLSSKIKFFAEVDVSSQNDFYRFDLIQDYAEYSRSRILFQFGLEF